MDGASALFRLIDSTDFLEDGSSHAIKRRGIGFIISLQGGLPAESSSPRTALLGP
jgi:hypothetical protein